MQININQRTIGLNFKNGQAELWVWAPEAKAVKLIIPSRSLSLILEQKEMGYWMLSNIEISPEEDYHFELISENNGEQKSKEYPDPASIFQPDGILGSSRSYDQSKYQWQDSGWKGMALAEFIIYEIHVGTFSQAGNFKGIEEKLDHLVDLGITAIELMPVAQFPGKRNWGYDGVFPFAVQNSYGGADSLKQLVDACHARGLAVILDVVYNHFGPEGNVAPNFGPYFTDKYKTPWGPAVNFDDAWSDGVRDFFIENALMWFRDFHIDALRLDAVHAIKDFSPTHILTSISEQVNQLSQLSGRKHYLLAELDLNDKRYIDSLEKKGYGMQGQWVDEFHHALRIATGQQPLGYYSDFNGLEDLAKAYNDAYVYTGAYSPHRKKKFGLPTDNPGEQFIVFSQNHDQVGNRMLGERSSQLVSFELLKVMAGAVFCAPFLPLIFMGEEWSSNQPFQYFINHSETSLIETVRNGRKAEFADFHTEGDLPDPASEETFNRSKLDWNNLDKIKHEQMFDYYKKLIKLRKSSPALQPDRKNSSAKAHLDKNLLLVRREASGQQMICILNFSDSNHELSFLGDLSGFKLALTSASIQFGGSIPIANTTNIPKSIQAQSILIFTR
ncbi:malto-oligosyltrehalose trehalohydrolase [Pedobacter aquatilis]|uniref:malto-oligosyltrehalose trehalohydrolase n=1 Tax=Pedobacter aquatilis TaxID=351343 RepID=UPI00292CDA73|nr:malto-oligosyltrehalose trehalohydrolase [Pedobacter aquatilis]